MNNAAEAEKLDQLLTKFPRLSIENQQYITGLIKGLKHAQKTAAAALPESGIEFAGQNENLG
ncbi:MAG: hypothetical protein LBI94_09215 [Treponema sp.]|jgi:hypothetical protein|nr:hypothetical protein [Treponema sp.]